MTSPMQRVLTFPGTRRLAVALEERPSRVVPAPAPGPTRPPRGRLGSRLDAIAASQSLWVLPVLLAQTVCCLHLGGRLADTSLLYLKTGQHVLTAMHHGTTTAGYLSGLPSLYAVPTAALERLGGLWLVHAAAVMAGLATTVFVYLATRRLFGQGPAIIAATVFAMNPAGIVATRSVSSVTPTMLLLAVAVYLATRATTSALHPIAIGVLVVAAAPVRYFAPVTVIGLVAVAALAPTSRRVGRRLAATVALLVASAVIAAVVAGHVVANQSWTGPDGGSVGDALGPGWHGLLFDSWTYVGALALVAAASLAVLRRSRPVALAIFVTGLVPVLIEVGVGDSSSLHPDTAYCAVVLAPLAGVAGMWLVRRGRRLALRAPVALATVIIALSSGFGATAATVDHWPLSSSLVASLNHYVRPGESRYFLDESAVPADELAGVGPGHEWVSTTTPRYAGPNGAEMLRNELADGDFSLVLTSGGNPAQGGSHGFDVTLRDRYTLVGRVPVTTGTVHTYLSLWLAELPR